jgi:hypothetical protein
MKIERVAFSMLWGVFLLIAAAAVIYGLLAATDAIVKLAVAVIAAAVGIVTALLNHSLNRLKEQEMEQRRRKEENYKAILALLGDYIRSPTEHRDKFASANLLSWVVGSPDVVKKTMAFLSTRDRDANTGGRDSAAGPPPESKADLLKQLLLAMRSDLGLPASDLGQSSVTALFPPVQPKAVGHLGD